MPETARTYAELIGTNYPDNTTGLISPEDIRDLVKTLEQLIRAHNDSERGSPFLYGPSGGAALTLQARGVAASGSTGAGGIALRLVSAVDQESDAIRVYRSAANLGNNAAAGWINSRMGIYTNAELIVSGNHTSHASINSLIMAAINGDVPMSMELSTAQVSGGAAMSIVGRKGGVAREEAILHSNGELMHHYANRGPVLRSADGTRWMLVVEDAGTLTLVRISTTDVGTDAQSAPAWLTTLITNLGGNAAWPAVYFAGAKVVASGGHVVTLKDARGAGFGPDCTKPGGDLARTGPYWDGGSAVKAMVARHQQLLLSASVAGLAPASIRSIVVVGAVDTDEDAMIAKVINADGHWGGLIMRSGTICADFYGTDGAGFHRPSSGVAGSRNIRTMVATHNGTNTYVDVPNTARVSHSAVTYNAGNGFARLFGDGTYVAGRFPLVMFGTNFLSEADVDTIRDAAVANLGAVNA